MEYLQFDYKKCNNHGFDQYFDFVLSRKTYKIYMYDLLLAKSDCSTNIEFRNQIDNFLKIQRIFFITPYFLTSFVFLYCFRKGIFKNNFLDREITTFSRLFLWILFIRMIQKTHIKYFGDSFLPLIHKDYHDYKKKINK